MRRARALRSSVERMGTGMGMTAASMKGARVRKRMKPLCPGPANASAVAVVAVDVRPGQPSNERTTAERMVPQMPV